MKKVSIIVPVYNCENYLIKCLSSLVVQTLDSYEIIIVDDASTDNTRQIITTFEKQFPALILAIFCDENHGPGGARNIGLSYASGEYIGFVDSDDIITTDMYEKLYLKAKEQEYDLVDCGFFFEAENKAILYTSDNLCGELTDQKRSVLISNGGFIWSKLYRKAFLDASDICFREHCTLEDSEYLIYLFATAKSIATVKEILYCYHDSASSISSKQSFEKYYQNATAAVIAIYNQLSPLENYPAIQSAVEYAILQLISYTVNLCISQNNTQELIHLKDYVNKYIHIPYQNNPFVKEKISESDIKILIKNNII